MSSSTLKKILTINPGSTSTKIAFFENDQETFKRELVVKAEDIKGCYFMFDQLEIRLKALMDFITEEGINIKELDMIVARGGSIHGVKSGAYDIDEHVVAMLRYAPRSQHPSSLAALMAYRLGKPYGLPIIFYDAPSADDADDIMHYTGLPEAKRFVTSHCLNSRMVAREIAEKLGRKYEDCNFIVAHLGGGITMAFHSGGRMIDTLLDDAGPMSPQRAGRIPVTDVIELCFSGRYTKPEMHHRMRGNGGLAAYFGVQDVREIEKMINEGNDKARDIYWYMAYQIAKGIGELAVVQCGKVDRIILTGGMAYSQMLTDWIVERVSFIAPIEIVPGEREMQALARGGLRVMNGEENIKKYTWLPEGYSSLEEFVAKFAGSNKDVI